MMYRVFTEYHNGNKIHSDHTTYGESVTTAFEAVAYGNAVRAWVIKPSGESIYIITYKEDGSIVESILP